MKKVLYIEENSQVRKTLTSRMNGLSNSIKMLTTRNVVEAVEICGQFDVDVVICEKQLDTEEMDLLDNVLSSRPNIKLVVLAPERTKSSTLLRPFAYSILIPTPVDPDVLFSTVCDLARIDQGGHIKGVSIASFLQMIGLEGKSCTLKVIADQEIGYLYFKEGNMIEAKFRDLTAMDAALGIMAMENPTIWMHNAVPTLERTIRAPLINLLLESSRQTDEAGSFDEQRRYARFLCSSPVELDYGGWTHHCVASNLSFSGLFLMTKGPFPEGQPVSVSLQSHRRDQSCKIDGTIVRREANGIGVRFAKLSLWQKKFLRDVLDEALPIYPKPAVTAIQHQISDLQ